MPTIDCGHWNGRRNRLPHLAGSIVWRSRWGRRFRLPVEADFHRHPIPKTVMHAPAAKWLTFRSRFRSSCAPAKGVARHKCDTVRAAAQRDTPLKLQPQTHPECTGTGPVANRSVSNAPIAGDHSNTRIGDIRGGVLPVRVIEEVAGGHL